MEITGYITSVQGQVARVKFENRRPTRHDILITQNDHPSLLEVIASDTPETFYCFILNPEHNLARGVVVKSQGESLMIPVGPGVLGRAFDIFGSPHDELGEIKSDQHRPLFAPRQQNLNNIQTPEEVVETGIKALDFFTPIFRGGKTAFVGGAGVGKTVILTAIINRLVVEAKSDQKTVAVYSAVGERSREAQELHSDLKEANALPYTSLILGQMGENPALRFRTAYAGATIAEYFRDDMSTNVLFFMDNVYRFAQAGHELATIMGQIPSEDGYQPTLSSEMAELNERLVSTKNASITSFLAVFVPSDDLTDYGVRSVFPYIDSIIILSREIFQSGRLPAIDLLRSTSAALNPLTIGEKHYSTYIRAKQIMEKATDLKRIVSLVGESELSQENQLVYRRSQLITNFMTQDLFVGSTISESVREFIGREETVDAISDIIDGKYDELQPDQLLYIGSIKNLGKQNKDLKEKAIQQQADQESVRTSS